MVSQSYTPCPRCVENPRMPKELAFAQGKARGGGAIVRRDWQLETFVQRRLVGEVTGRVRAGKQKAPDPFQVDRRSAGGTDARKHEAQTRSLEFVAGHGASGSRAQLSSSESI